MCFRGCIESKTVIVFLEILQKTRIKIILGKKILIDIATTIKAKKKDIPYYRTNLGRDFCGIWNCMQRRSEMLFPYSSCLNIKT